MSRHEGDHDGQPMPSALEIPAGLLPPEPEDEEEDEEAAPSAPE